MNKINRVIVILVVIIGIAFLSTRLSSKNKSDVVYNQTTSTSFESQSNNEGDVVVTVTPVIGSGLEFEIALNTHSVDIGEDLAVISVLIDSDGKEYAPIGWQGSPVGGHHRQGILLFDEIKPQPKSITLVIREIGGIAKREFSWVLLK